MDLEFYFYKPNPLDFPFWSQTMALEEENNGILCAYFSLKKVIL